MNKLQISVAKHLLLISTLILFSNASAEGPTGSPGYMPVCGESQPPVGNSGCFLKIESYDLKNIQFYPHASNASLYFRRASVPGKLYRYPAGTNVLGAKALLSILLTAYATGTRVKVWIDLGSAHDDPSSVSYFTDVVLDP